MKTIHEEAKTYYKRFFNKLSTQPNLQNSPPKIITSLKIIKYIKRYKQFFIGIQISNFKLKSKTIKIHNLYQYNCFIILCTNQFKL